MSKRFRTILLVCFVCLLGISLGGLLFYLAWNPDIITPLDSFETTPTPITSNIILASDTFTMRRQLTNDAMHALTSKQLYINYTHIPGEEGTFFKAKLGALATASATTIVETFPTTGHQSKADKQLFIEHQCFNIQSSIWQDSLLRDLDEVDFIVGKVQNGQVVQIYGECSAHASVARNANWGYSTYLDAWGNNSIYDDSTPNI
jgi:hypothetical protein